jgi:hypothetical protein
LWSLVVAEEEVDKLEVLALVVSELELDYL